MDSTDFELQSLAFGFCGAWSVARLSFEIFPTCLSLTEEPPLDEFDMWQHQQEVSGARPYCPEKRALAASLAA